jgi:hypothetical protein
MYSFEYILMSSTLLKAFTVMFLKVREATLDVELKNVNSVVEELQHYETIGIQFYTRVKLSIKASACHL